MEKKITVSEKKVKEGLFKFLSEFYKVLSDATRIGILDMLYSNKPKALTFTDIFLRLRKNPNTINIHLKRLMKYGLVEKVEKGKYRITEIGTMALNVSAIDIVTLTKKAIEIGKAKGYIISED